MNASYEERLATDFGQQRQHAGHVSWESYSKNIGQVKRSIHQQISGTTSPTSFSPWSGFRVGGIPILYRRPDVSFRCFFLRCLVSSLSQCFSNPRQRLRRFRRLEERADQLANG